MKLRLEDFDYPLDGDLIAQTPLPRRDDARLMVLHRPDGNLRHHVFRELPRLLRPGDLLVLNDTRVIPAKFQTRRAAGPSAGGGTIEGLFLRECRPGTWEVMLKGAGRCKPGETLTFTADPAAAIQLRADLGRGLWRVAACPPRSAADLLDRVGTTPLPPYIRRPDAGRDPLDRRRYQTVYAARPGAVAAPTAGLHFTSELLQELDDNRIQRVGVTLHVGLGTFQPVLSPDLSQHRMHAEWYELGPEAAERINAARRDRRRIIAVGTTSLRVLEAVPSGPDEPFLPRTGWTDLFLYPPARFRAVDAMITNFHLPKSTLLMLAAAFCAPGGTEGLAMILDAYAQAARLKYRFYSYGDAMLIE